MGPVCKPAVMVEIGDAMGQALFQVVPLALAAALSSVPISATIFILLSEGRTRSGLAFLAGTVIGTFVAITLVTAVGQALPGRPRPHAALLGRLEIVLGIAMVLLGVFTLVRRSASSGRGARWMDGLGSLGMVPVFGIGLALNLRPKAILLVAAAGLAISRARPVARGEPCPDRHLHSDRDVHGSGAHRGDDLVPAHGWNLASSRRRSGSPHTPPGSAPHS